MFMVYWTENGPSEDGAGQGVRSPRQQLFESGSMGEALSFMEQLRTRQRAGEGIGFVTMASENPDSVGHAGVDVTGPGYGWTKRRHRF